MLRTVRETQKTENAGGLRHSLRQKILSCDIHVCRLSHNRNIVWCENNLVIQSRLAEEGLKSRQVNYVNISITGIAL